MRGVVLVFMAVWIGVFAVATRRPRRVLVRGHRHFGCLKLRCGARSVLLSPEVEKGLLWLARHQSPDGRWSALRFTEQCPGVPCRGASAFVDDERTTALAVLAFLGAGPEPLGECADPFVREDVNLERCLCRGLEWLIERQDREGAIGPRDELLVARQSAAALALAVGARRYPTYYTVPADAAVAFLESASRADGPFAERAKAVARTARTGGEWTTVIDAEPASAPQLGALRGCGEGAWDSREGRMAATIHELLRIEHGGP